MQKLHKIIFLLFSLLSCPTLWAQTTNQAYWSYIDQYKGMAIDQMKRYRIPASITLAQGLLESRYGLSELAVKGNNHFGIKCHSNWAGKKMYPEAFTLAVIIMIHLFPGPIAVALYAEMVVTFDGKFR